MRRAPLLVALAVLSPFVQSCAPPKPTAPESTAVYDQLPESSPAPITRLSVNEPAPEALGTSAAPAAPAAPAEPAAVSPSPAEATPPPAASLPPSVAPAATAPAASAATPAPAKPAPAPSPPAPPAAAPATPAKK